MRQFVVVGHDAPTAPEFSLDDLPGAGRLDVLCRAITDALLTSHDVREDVRVRVVLADEFTVRIEGSEVRRLNPDERSTAALIRTALEERAEAVGHVPVETTPGVYLSRRDTAAALAAAAEEGAVLHLDAEGRPAVDVDPPADPVFVLSDHREFTATEREALADAAAERISLGPERLHGNQAVTVAHNWLDTDGFERY